MIEKMLTEKNFDFNKEVPVHEKFGILIKKKMV